MTGKIQKLTELSELLKSGAITPQEFEVLKNEILSESEVKKEKVYDASNFKKETITHQSHSSSGKKVLLKSFHSEDGKFTKAPGIEYLDMLNLSSEEIRILKSFLSRKQLAAPQEMTQDEIEIGNKIFTKKEIERINSERSGLNFPLLSLGSIGMAIFPIFLIYISPCLMYFGGITSCVGSVISSFMVLTNSSSTKLDKQLAGIALAVVVFVFAYFGIKWKSI